MMAPGMSKKLKRRKDKGIASTIQTRRQSALSCSLQQYTAAVPSTPDVPITPIANPHPTIMTSQSTNWPSSNAGSTSTKKGRGCTQGLGLTMMNKALGRRMQVELSVSQGRPLDVVQSAKLSSELGIVAREFLPHRTCWKQVTAEEKMKGIDQIKVRLDVKELNENRNVHRSVEQILQHRARDKRYQLHMHFNKYGASNKPEDVTQEDWTALCKYWGKKKTMERCIKARESRKLVKTSHNQGSRAFVAARHEISKNEFNGQECDRITFYHHTHFTPGVGGAPGNWISPVAEQQYNMMVAMKEQSEQDGNPLSADEICDNVLGMRSGYIVGLGHGPKPEGVRSSGSLSKKLEEALQKTQEENDAIKADNASMKAELHENRCQLKMLAIQMERQQKLLEAFFASQQFPVSSDVQLSGSETQSYQSGHGDSD